MLASLVDLDLFSPVELTLSKYSFINFVDDFHVTWLVTVLSFVDGLYFDLSSLMTFDLEKLNTSSLGEQVGKAFNRLILR